MQGCLPPPPAGVAFFSVPEDCYVHKDPKQAIQYDNKKVNDKRLRAFAETHGALFHRKRVFKNGILQRDAEGNIIVEEVQAYIQQGSTGKKKDFFDEVRRIASCDSRIRASECAHFVTKNNPCRCNASTHPCECGWHINYRYNWTLPPIQPPPAPAVNVPAVPPLPLVRQPSVQPVFPVHDLPSAFCEAFGGVAEYYGKILYECINGKLSRRKHGVQTCYPPPDPSTLAFKPELSEVRKLYVIAPISQTRRALKCPGCKKEVRPRGWYHRPRIVLGSSSLSWAVAEYYECKDPSTRACGRFAAWDDRLLSQLPPGTRQLFYPIIFTWRGAVDTDVIMQLRIRSVGNTPALKANQANQAGT